MLFSISELPWAGAPRRDAVPDVRDHERGAGGPAPPHPQDGRRDPRGRHIRTRPGIPHSGGGEAMVGSYVVVLCGFFCTPTSTHQHPHLHPPTHQLIHHTQVLIDLQGAGDSQGMVVGGLRGVGVRFFGEVFKRSLFGLVGMRVGASLFVCHSVFLCVRTTVHTTVSLLYPSICR